MKVGHEVTRVCSTDGFTEVTEVNMNGSRSWKGIMSAGGTHVVTFQHESPSIGDKLRVISPSNSTRTVTVVDADATRIKVHYEGHDGQPDEWLQNDSDRIRGSQCFHALHGFSAIGRAFECHVCSASCGEDKLVFGCGVCCYYECPRCHLTAATGLPTRAKDLKAAAEAGFQNIQNMFGGAPGGALPAPLQNLQNMVGGMLDGTNNQQPNNTCSQQ